MVLFIKWLVTAFHPHLVGFSACCAEDQKETLERSMLIA